MRSGEGTVSLQQVDSKSCVISASNLQVPASRNCMVVVLGLTQRHCGMQIHKIISSVGLSWTVRIPVPMSVSNWTKPAVVEMDRGLVCTYVHRHVGAREKRQHSVQMLIT